MTIFYASKEIRIALRHFKVFGSLGLNTQAKIITVLQTQFAKVMFLHMSVILSTEGGACIVAPLGGHAWLLSGVCMVAPSNFLQSLNEYYYSGWEHVMQLLLGGVCDCCSGGACELGCSQGGMLKCLLLGGLHGCSGGVCVQLLQGNMHGCSIKGGCAWLLQGEDGVLWDRYKIWRYGQWAGGMHPTGMHSC